MAACRCVFDDGVVIGGNLWGGKLCFGLDCGRGWVLE